MSEALNKMGFLNYTGIDLIDNPFIVGDIINYKKLNLKEKTFDLIIAFEVVEHVDCFKEVYDLLKEDGLFFVTTSLPHMDWFCKILKL